MDTLCHSIKHDNTEIEEMVLVDQHTLALALTGSKLQSAERDAAHQTFRLNTKPLSSSDRSALVVISHVARERNGDAQLLTHQSCFVNFFPKKTDNTSHTSNHHFCLSFRLLRGKVFICRMFPQFGGRTCKGQNKALQSFLLICDRVQILRWHEARYVQKNCSCWHPHVTLPFRQSPQGPSNRWTHGPDKRAPSNRNRSSQALEGRLSDIQENRPFDQ